MDPLPAIAQAQFASLSLMSYFLLTHALEICRFFYSNETCERRTVVPILCSFWFVYLSRCQAQLSSTRSRVSTSRT